MDRLQRIYKLHQVIAAHRLPVPHSVLQEKLECSRATVNRIIEEMRLYFNAPIEYDRSRNGYHYALTDGETSVREISPQRLIHYRDNWYLDAYCHTRNALRSFAVERITAAKAMPQRCRDISEKQLDSHYASSYGIFAGKAKHMAVLRFTPERARWVADEHWHPQQQSRTLEDGSYELRIPYSDPRELVMDILKHSGEVEVVSPEALRDAVAERLKNALEHYR